MIDWYPRRCWTCEYWSDGAVRALDAGLCAEPRNRHEDGSMPLRLDAETCEYWTLASVRVVRDE